MRAEDPAVFLEDLLRVFESDAADAEEAVCAYFGLELHFVGAFLFVRGAAHDERSDVFGDVEGRGYGGRGAVRELRLEEGELQIRVAELVFGWLREGQVEEEDAGWFLVQGAPFRLLVQEAAVYCCAAEFTVTEADIHTAGSIAEFGVSRAVAAPGGHGIMLSRICE